MTNPDPGKNIVVCSDGTGQSGGMLNPSNVWRLYQALDKNTQACIHDDGVGSGGNKLIRTVGGAFGLGISRNLKQIYRFLINQYEPKENPRLFFFGFSRGAFTVRVLTQMVCMFGIPNARGKTPAEIDAICQDILRRYKTANQELKELGRSETAEEFVNSHCQYDYAEGSEENNGQHDSRKVHFLGVWDTVEALGLPIDEFTQAFKQLFPLKFGDNKPHPNVKNIYHALSIDEERRTFTPKLFNESSLANGQSVTQVWFPGCHAHVGGGYPKDQLAFNALLWMIKHAEDENLRFDEETVQSFQARAAYDGSLNDSRSGLRMFYRYGPRHIPMLCNEAGIKPVLHHTAMRRIEYEVDGYSPSALGAHWDDFLPFQVDNFPDGKSEVMPLGDDVPENTKLNVLKQNLLEAQRLTRSRGLIFYAMFLTLVFGVLWGAVAYHGEGRPAWIPDWITSNYDQLVAKSQKVVEFEHGILKFLAGIVPGFVGFIFKGLIKTPGVFLLLSLNFVAFFLADKLNIKMIRDQAAKGWKALRPASPETSKTKFLKLHKWLIQHPILNIVLLTAAVHIVLILLTLIPRISSWQPLVKNSSWFVASVCAAGALIAMLYWLFNRLVPYAIKLVAFILDSPMRDRRVRDQAYAWRETKGPILGFALFFILMIYCSGMIWKMIT